MTDALTGTPILELVDVHKAFRDAAGDRPVLVGVDLTISAGEIVALVGRSGSGKTTVLTIAAGLDDPDRGSVRLFGRAIEGRVSAWDDLAILPQALGLLGELTLAENIALPLRLGRIPDAIDVDELMARLSIERLAGRFPDEVSLGEQQRAALARAAVVRPRLLLADEPISHQNDALATAMMDVIVDLAARGTACLLATHNDVAFEFAHRVLQLRDGVLGAPEQGLARFPPADS